MRWRRAVAGDLAVVETISHAAYAPWVPILGGPPLPLTDDYGARIAEDEVWIVEDDTGPLAVLVLRPEADHLVIESLAVPPAAQGQGVGRWMLDQIERRAVADGTAELRLFANARMARNLAIYAKAGFRETGRRADPRRPGWVFVDMAKRLPA